MYLKRNRWMMVILSVIMLGCVMLPMYILAAESQLEETHTLETIQEQMDGILTRYLGSNNVSEDEIIDLVISMGWNEMQTALDDITSLEKPILSLTVDELEQLEKEYEGAETLVCFYEVLNASMTPMVLAASGTHTPTTGVTVEVSGATNNSMSNGTITVTAKGSAGVFGFGASAKTTTITVNNSGSGKATVSFDWKATSVNQLTIDGTVYSSTSGSFSKVMEEETSFTITIQTGKNATVNEFVMSDFARTEAGAAFSVTFEYDDGAGTVTVDDGTVANGEELSITAEGAALKATGTFVAWVDKATGRILSTDNSFTLMPQNDMVVKAVLTSDACFMSEEEIFYEDLSKAIEANINKIILINNGILRAGDYTIPAGVTLLIPFDDAKTVYTTEPATENAYIQPTAYRTMSMDDGASITVEKGGAISVSGKHSAKMNSYNGQPTGPQGFIAMNEGSNITVEDGGALYAWGYIVGEKRTNNNETPLGGTVTIEDGGLVYECFQVTDYRGGTATSGMTSGSNINTYHVFPMSQYYVQNIQVPMIVYAGATENGYFSVNVSRIGNKSAPVPFIGNEGMFRINSGYLVKDYDEKNDRLVIDIFGDIEMAPMNIDINAGTLGMTVHIDSNNYILPLTNNITVTLHSGYTVDITQDLAILPGAELIVDEGAVVNIGTSETSKNVYAYDVGEWGGYCGEYNDIIRPLSYAYDRFVSRTANDLEDAIVLVNGIVDCTYGYAYTTLGGANICSTGTGQVISGVPGTKTNTYQATQGGTGKASTDISYSSIQIVPAILKNADGIDPSYVETSGATTVTIYNYYAGVWRPQFDIYATSVRVGDSLELYFYIQKEDLQGITDYTAKLVRTKEGQEESEAEVIPFTATSTTSGWEEYGEYYRFYYDDIAAKEMTDEIKVTIYYDDGSNRAASTLCEESIQSYALRTLGRTTDSDTNLRTVLVDMLNYGEACQNYFDGYNSDDLATTGLTDTQSDYGSQNKAEYSMEDIKGSYSASFSAKSNLMFTFYFTQPTSGTATVTYKDHYGNTQTPQVSISGPISVTDEDTRETITYYYVDVPGLAVADGRQILTCTITDGSEETTFKGSVQSFIAQRTERYDAKVEAGTATEKEALEMAAYEMLLKFVDSARIYFGTSSNPYE